MKPARKNAFTLIELLVVIAIVGVLAAVVLVAINPTRRMKQARDSGRKSDVGQIATAAQAYYTTMGYYAPDIAALVSSGDLKQEPKDPQGNSYGYSRSANSEEAAVWATIEAPTSSNPAYTIWCWRSTTGTASETSGCTP